MRGGPAKTPHSVPMALWASLLTLGNEVIASPESNSYTNGEPWRFDEQKNDINTRYVLILNFKVLLTFYQERLDAVHTTI